MGGFLFLESFKKEVDTMVSRVHNRGMLETKMQDVRIRSVPVPLVNKLKSILVMREMTLAEWFVEVAAKEKVKK